jgi:hypothetical protein
LQRNRECPINYEINAKDLVVAAFVRDEKTREILQSVLFTVNP